MKKYWKAIVAAGSMLVFINVIYFIVPFKHTIKFLLGDGFTCAGLGMLIYAIYLSSVWKDATSRFWGWPILRAGVRFYCGIFILNFFLILLDQISLVPLWLLFFANIFVFGVESLLLFGINGERNFVKNQRENREQKKENMKHLYQEVGELEIQCEDPDLLDAIKHLKKEIQYSDPNSSAGSLVIEREIQEELNKLGENLHTDTAIGIKSIERISRLLKFRNQKVIEEK